MGDVKTTCLKKLHNFCEGTEEELFDFLFLLRKNKTTENVRRR